MYPTAPFNMNANTASEEGAEFMAGGTSSPFPVASVPLDPNLIPFLENTQGNILQPHGRTFGLLQYVRFEHELLGDRRKCDDLFRKISVQVTNAHQQYRDSEERKCLGDDYGDRKFVSFALTAAGIGDAGRDMPTEASGAAAFQNGIRPGFLGDSVDSKGFPKHWERFYTAPNVHGVWLLAHRTSDGLKKLRKEFGSKFSGLLKVVHEEGMVTVRDEQGFAREPFGFRDGISMPRYFCDPIKKPLVNPPLENLLLDSGGPTSCCSFMVVRKLEQNVEAFSDFEAKLRPILAGKKLDTEDPGRLLVGRYRDGRLLAPELPAPTNPASIEQIDFKFDSDMEGKRCPFSAHIRKAYFRQPQIAGGVRPDRQLDAQFVRRGMLYGTEADLPIRPKGGARVGLMFMAYMANISGQFETLQTSWFQGGDVPVPDKSQPDPLLFKSFYPDGKWAWKEHGISNVELSDFVTPRGGIYLFVPAISWLRKTASPIT